MLFATKSRWHTAFLSRLEGLGVGYYG